MKDTRPTYVRMFLPSTANEVILSMSDVESREKLYDVGLELKNVELLHSSFRRNCTTMAKFHNTRLRKKDFKKRQVQNREDDKVTTGVLCQLKGKYEATLVGLHKQQALENGHFRKDIHRLFRMGLYTKRSRPETL